MRTKICTWLLFALTIGSHAFAQLPQKATDEIEQLLTEKYSRNPAQQKMDSRLLQFVREQRGQRMVAGVNLDAVHIETYDDGDIIVDIDADVDDQLVSKIESIGGKVLFTSALFHSMRVQIKPALAENIAALSAVRFVKAGARPRLVGKPTAIQTEAARNMRSNLRNKASFDERAKRIERVVADFLWKAEAAPLTGPVNGQGDRTHRTDDTRNTYGFAGQGIRIGVLSDSYDLTGGAAADVANGELPGPGNPLGNTTPVTVIQENSTRDGGDEGRAMLQIIHDLAPKAQLFFATAYNGPASFASNILALHNAPNNCDIIVDDIGYSDEPAFYDGIIAQAVNTVTASGALYFSAAGNDGSLAKNTSGVFEGDFSSDGSSLFSGSSKAGSVHNFGTISSPVGGDSIILPGNWYLLDWADIPGASANDYDLFVVSASGAVKASSTNVQNGRQNPFEYILTPPSLSSGDRLVVFKAATAAPRAFRLNTAGGRLKYGTIGQTYGHAAAANAFGVAATPAASPFSAATQRGPFPAAFNSANQVEAFSSDGPRRIFFNPNGTPITPGNFLFSTNGGINRNKPDITAANGVGTTLSSSSGLNPFYGTSAAAPHAGAIAALLKSANPSLTPAQTRGLLTTTTVDIEAPGFDNVSGYGIIDAFEAMQLLSPSPQATITLGSIAASEGSFSNGNGRIDPGEVANLSVQLNNPSLVTATSVVGVLSTSTPGVTVLQNTAAYGAINGGGGMLNMTPFSIAVNSSLACGTTVNFYINVSFAGGASPIVFPFAIPVGAQPYAGGIVSTLGSAPPSGAGYTVVAGQQTGRVVRGATPSTCALPLTNPGLTAITGSRQYDAYTFTNTNGRSECVSVTLTSPNISNIFAVAYNELGFVPSNPSTNFLAAPSISAIPEVFSFTVGAGKAFTIVVHDVNVVPASNSPYNLSLSLSNCSAGPACTPLHITTVSLPEGSTGSPYSQEFAATGGSGNYQFSVIGNLPAGIAIVDNKLTGTPTQAGTFPIKILASDVTGCPADTSAYSLVIAGIAPASLAVVTGTPQSTLPLSSFNDSLKVIVRDNDNNPLSGVNVVFNSPVSGAGALFAGGMKTITVVSDSNGIAAAGVTANATTGTYTVTATVVGVPDAIFSLSNSCPGSFLVTSNADSGPGTLRSVIDNACAGISVVIHPSVTNIVLTSGEIVITKAITIAGAGASKLSISGNNNSRIFTVAADTSANVAISGMTLRDGKTSTSSDFGGGAILIYSGKVNLRNCNIVNNDASVAFYPEGGGIDNEGGQVVINRCTIANNTAFDDGGGIVHWGGSMTIINSTISANIVATSGAGGGIYSVAPLTMFATTVYGNAARIGGNIYRAASTVNFSNCIIAAGSLTGTGGSAPDISGTSFISGDYNLIQTTAGGTITGVTTHNITGVNPNLLPLANYGGEFPVLLPRPTSAVINAGDPALTSGVDQRGYPRLVGSAADIGPVEAGYAVVATSGASQRAVILTNFTLPLQARITENANAIQNVPVVFRGPSTGAGGVFPNLQTADTVTTNASGIATSRLFRANNIAGAYYDTAWIGNAFPAATYPLTNVVSGDSPLPLAFGAINASASNCTVTINWETLTEVNTKDFSIEQSVDGTVFTTLTTTPAKGNSTTLQKYKYTHESTNDGVSYYRIRQTDLDGAFTYSNVLLVSHSCGRDAIVAYPNPIKNVLTVIVPGTDKRLLEISDAVGRKLYHQSVAGGRVEINASGWVSGVYTLTVVNKGQRSYSMKLIKD